MKAVCWGANDVRVETVPDQNYQPRDAIVKITSAICGSDHIYDGYIPTMSRATSWS